MMGGSGCLCACTCARVLVWRCACVFLHVSVSSYPCASVDDCAHSDLDACAPLHCFACECVARGLCALATVCLRVGVGPVLSSGWVCSEGPRWFSGCGIQVLEPCVCDLGRCVRLQELEMRGSLEQERQCQDCQKAENWMH